MVKKKRAIEKIPMQITPQKIRGMLDRIPDGRMLSENFALFIEACNLAVDDLAGRVKSQHAETIFDEGAALGRWKEARLHTISPTCYEIFAQCFAWLLQASIGEAGEPTYFDVVGSVYMSTLEGSRWNQDQYYTPAAVAECMAQMSMHDADVAAEFRRRSMEVIAGDPVLQALVLAGGVAAQDPTGGDFARDFFLTRIWPLVSQKIKPFSIYDPCCGSGVLLLAAAKQIPRWLIDIGFVKFYGMDIQHIAVRMCQLNMKLYGLA